MYTWERPLHDQPRASSKGLGRIIAHLVLSLSMLLMRLNVHLYVEDKTCDYSQKDC